MNFSERFDYLCKERGVSRSEILAGLNLSSSKISLWKNSLPKAEYMEKIAAALNCSVADFFTDGPTLNRQQPVTAPAESTLSLTDDETDILRIYRQLPRRKQHEFMMYCYGLEPSTDQEDLR